MRSRQRPILRAAALLGVLALAQGCAQSTGAGVVGINRQQFFAGVSSSNVEQTSVRDFTSQNSRAQAQGALITSGPDYLRVRGIMDRLIPQTGLFRPDAPGWAWELVLINTDSVNAHVTAGGKVTVYTGLYRKLGLTDPELAAVIGHEMAHALREHTREKLAKSQAGTLVTLLGGIALQAGAGVDARGLMTAGQKYLWDLPNSRELEAEADAMGIELMARAGYDPHGAVTLWQKMMGLSGGQSGVAFESTHPSHASRIVELMALEPKARPLYEAARAGTIPRGR